MPIRPPTTGNAYFDPQSSVKFFSTGCTLLDCVIGGGYPVGRIVNLVGDKSTGKTLLAIEACANFHRKFPQGAIWYAEAESAFDISYAAALGMPVDAVSFVSSCFTIEDLFEDLRERILKHEADRPGLYILDSLDALSDRAEQNRDLDEGSYGTAKAKQLSQLFRRLVQQLGDKQITVIVISQVRDNIGVTFGRKTTRSGGRALDFYASVVLYLAQVKSQRRTVRGIERVTGVIVKAKCDKNKISLPFRECEFPIQFGYGIEDVEACLDWLALIKRLDVIGITSDQGLGALRRKLRTADHAEYCEKQQSIAAEVRKLWAEIEVGFQPTRSKYGGLR